LSHRSTHHLAIHSARVRTTDCKHRYNTRSKGQPLPPTKTKSSKEKKQKTTKRQWLTQTLQHIITYYHQIYFQLQTLWALQQCFDSTVTSTATPTVNNLRVIRFNGNTNAYTVQEWLAFFEFAINGISDEHRIGELWDTFKKMPSVDLSAKCQRMQHVWHGLK
jgi:hypothetical protein